MKRVFVYLMTAVLAALSICSCNKTGDPEEDNNGQLKAGPYKFKASVLKGTWEAGDVIYVKGGTGSSAESITIKASDLSDGGKTATLILGEVTADILEPDGLYAAWPDEAVQHSYGVLKPKTTFKSCERPVCVAYLDGDTFTFIDASSAIDFTVSGGYEEYAFAAAGREGLIYKTAEVEYSSANKKITPKQSDGYPFIYGNVANGSANRILFTGEVKMKGGYTLFLKKGGKWCATYSESKDVTLKPGQPLDLGDISAKLTAYDGPEPRMPQLIKFTKYSVNFNELSGICLSADEDFLWGIDDDGRLGRISFEGKLLDSYYVGSDPEEVSLNYDTKDLLIAIEPKGVGLVKGPDYNTKYTKIFSIPGTDISDENAGMEGLTYYKNGQVFCGTQTNSHLYLCDIATGEVIWDKILYNKDQVSEIAGLFFDRLTNWLWIIDSESKKIFVFDETATNLLGTYSVSEPSNPESVCVDHKHNCVWVGDDYGSTSYLYKYEFTGLDDAIIQ